MIIDDVLVERVELTEVPVQPPPRVAERVQLPEPRDVIPDEERIEGPLRSSGTALLLLGGHLARRSGSQEQQRNRHCSRSRRRRARQPRSRGRRGIRARAGRRSRSSNRHSRRAVRHTGLSGCEKPRSSCGAGRRRAWRQRGAPEPRHGAVVGVERGVGRLGGGDDERGHRAEAEQLQRRRVLFGHGREGRVRERAELVEENRLDA